MKRFLSDYGMIVALLVLCALFSWLTWDEQHPEGTVGGNRLAGMLKEESSATARILVAARENAEDREFSSALLTRLADSGRTIVATVHGSPRDVRQAIEQALAGGGIDLVACTPAVAKWPILTHLSEVIPASDGVKVFSPEP